ncbi:MAG: hypothetical protein NWF01_08760 [Candidatus Bathyarchaeota archaeon]|nr:hypothetical protein [Candidatus Bathyarchaeota archaeon]
MSQISEQKTQKSTTTLDRFNWSNKKTEIEEKPRSLMVGQSCIVIYSEYEEVTEHREGISRKNNQPYSFDVKYFKLPCKWLPNRTKGYVLLTEEQFTECAQRFADAGYPAEMVYVRTK